MWIVAVLVAELTVVQLLQWLWWRSRREGGLYKLLVSYMRSLLGIYLFTFNSVLQGALAVFDVIEVQVEGESRSLLRAYPGVYWSTGSPSEEYKTILAFSIIFLILYVAVVPTVLLFSIHLTKKKKETVRKIMQLIQSPFKDTHLIITNWELVRILLRTVFQVVVSQARNFLNALSLVAFFLLVYSFSLAHLQPHKLRSSQIGEEISMFVLISLCCFTSFGYPNDGVSFAERDRVWLTLLSAVTSLAFILWIIRARIMSAVIPRLRALEHEESSLILMGSRLSCCKRAQLWVLQMLAWCGRVLCFVNEKQFEEANMNGKETSSVVVAGAETSRDEEIMMDQIVANPLSSDGNGDSIANFQISSSTNNLQ